MNYRLSNKGISVPAGHLHTCIIYRHMNLAFYFASHNYLEILEELVDRVKELEETTI